MTEQAVWAALCLFLAAAHPSAVAQQTDGSLLLSLKKAVTNWNDLSHENSVQGWIDVPAVCSWTGITCNSAGAVTGVDLACDACPVQAIGSLPAELANVTSLKTINLAGHLFSGPLPASWSELQELTYLNLSSNRMTRTIPAEWTELDTFPQLQLLALSGNQLSGLLPDDLHMPALLELHLESNILSGSLPSAWSGSMLPELTGLYLASNNLSGKLPELWGLSEAFPSLQELDLTANALTGSLPAAWGSAAAWQALQSLRMSANTLDGILPDTWADPAAFPSLTVLALDNNTLAGPLPVAWGELAGFGNLTTLTLANNGLSHSLPVSWAASNSFPSLTTLYLDINHIAGTLPMQWGAPGAFARLKCLSLVYNKLSGQLPSEWGQAGSMPELQDLWLSTNQLSGLLPPSWGTTSGLAALQDVRLDWNRLTGSIPPSWAEFPSLQALSVRPGNDYLCGGLPAGANFQLCKTVDGSCSPLAELGGLCRNSYAGAPHAPGPPAHSSSLQILLRIEGVSPQAPIAMVKSALQSALSGTIPAADAALIIIVDMQQVAAAPALHPDQPEHAQAGRRLLEAAGSTSVLRGRGLQQQVGSLNSVEATVQMTTATGNSLADMESQLTSAVAGGELLMVMNDLNVPANAIDLVDAVPFNAATPPAAASTAVSAGGPSSSGRDRETWELALEIILPTVTALLAVGTLIFLFRHRVWCSVKNRFSPSTTPKEDSPRKDPAMGDYTPNGTHPHPLGAPSDTHGLEGSLQLSDMGAYASLYVSPFEHSSNAPDVSQHAPAREVPGQNGMLPGASVPSWFHRNSSNLPYLPAEDLDAPGASHSGPLLVRRREAELEAGVRPLQMTSSRSMPSLRDAEAGDATAGPPGTAQHGQVSVPDSWDPQVLWDLAQQTSAANNGYAPARSWRSGDSPLLARGTGPGRPDPPQTPYSETLIHSIQAAIHAASDSSTGGVSTPDSLPPVLAPHSQGVPRESTGSSTGGQQGEGGSDRGGDGRQGMLRLPSLPWSDWEVRESDVAICKRPDGSDWELGGGAFGKVYKAMLGGSSIVAVKVLHETEEAADFGQEIAILRSCRHSNIVQFQGACVREGRVLLVTEFLPGGDLWHALGKPSVSRPIFAWHVWGHKVALDIARGLHFLHSRARPIAHFDLKSHNILLAADGTAKIADVGLARILNQEYVSKLDEVAGTFAWAAPELLLGRRCSEKVDIFAFGVVLWELATGERPCRGQMREVRVPEELPGEVNALMQCCLDVEPKLRPSAKQIFECLSHAAQTQ